MKIEINRNKGQTIKEFAEKHDLTMVVNERDPGLARAHGLSRFYAHFKHAEVKIKDFLVTEAGQGETISQAVNDYAFTISGKCLILHATSENRKEILVPHFTGEWNENDE